MDRKEIALQLTLKAMELRYVPNINVTHDPDGKINQENVYNFYNSMLENIKLSPDRINNEQSE